MKTVFTLVAICLALTAICSAETMKPVDRVDTDQPYVTLTFDDGPNGENMRAILKILQQEDAKATFFLVGKNVNKDPELTRLTMEQGHEIANHTMTHARLTELSADEVTAQIEDAQSAIEEATGFKPDLFRAPFRAKNEEVLAIVSEQGLSEIGANRSVGDWQKDITEEKIIERATKNVKAGDIILMHSWSGHTRKALPEIIAAYKAKGLRCVTMSELLASEKKQSD